MGVCCVVFAVLRVSVTVDKVSATSYCLLLLHGVSGSSSLTSCGSSFAVAASGINAATLSS